MSLSVPLVSPPPPFNKSGDQSTCTIRIKHVISLSLGIPDTGLLLAKDLRVIFEWSRTIVKPDICACG